MASKRSTGNTGNLQMDIEGRITDIEVIHREIVSAWSSSKPKSARVMALTSYYLSLVAGKQVKNNITKTLPTNAKRSASEDDEISQEERRTKCKIALEEQEHDGPTRRSGRQLCSVAECTNKVYKGGVCRRHGAKVKRCNHEGCTNQAQKEEYALGMGQR